jgi:deoxyribodipyrimidine photo-lyase
MYSIFIFRRDLRLNDNLGLIHAIKNCKNIIPIFIFSPEQVINNKFKSNNAIQFMIESLKDLDLELKNKNSKLYIFQGENIKILSKISKLINISNIIFNVDYTPYARKRDQEILDFCKKHDISCHMIQDYLLDNIGKFLKKDGDPYTVYTPFKNNLIKHNINKPQKITFKNLIKTNKLKDDGFIKYSINENILVNGGRKLALSQLNKIKNQKKYNDNRNTLSIETTLLSAYIKFGCLSIREVYWKFRNELGLNNGLIPQLIWREFYYYISYYFPQVLDGKNYNSKYDKIKWNTNTNNFKKWCIAETGYPIIDAGMRELNLTGYMHNRSRLITSNFMNRILGYDWRFGEKYYATQLTDYDPSVNNGNWQWIASTGVDPKPYFQRLFNPWLQSKKFDPDCLYIKKWIPELKNIPNNEIHEWEKYYHKYNLKEIKYFKPIVEYKIGREKSIKTYRAVL